MGLVKESITDFTIKKTRIKCELCHGANVKLHEYVSFSYHYCVDCKDETKVYHDTETIVQNLMTIPDLPEGNSPIYSLYKMVD